MPNVADFDNQKLWMAACVPERTSEGDEHAQAVATCLSIWSEAHKAIDYNEEISAIRSEWNRQNPDGVMPVMEVGSWIVTVRSDAVIVEVGNKFYEVTYSKDDDDRVTFVPRTEWQEVEHAYVPAKNNALKALSRNSKEIRVGNYIVLFGGRDLEGIRPGSTVIEWTNPDGSRGEYFTPDTVFESNYTKTGRLSIDWEHGKDTASGKDDTLGYVDWGTAKADERGVWVMRVLDRHNRYVQWLEELIDAGIIGSSSDAVPEGVQKADDGAITHWPLRRDTLTVVPMEWRNKSENLIRAAKALGIETNTETHEAEPEADPSAVSVVKARVDIELFLIESLQEQYQ